MTDRLCAGCGFDLTGQHGQVRWCSAACRSWVRNGHSEYRTLPETCKTCKGSMAGKRARAVFCSRKCKTAASEQRRPDRDNRARYRAERGRRLEAAKAYAKANPHIGQASKRRRKSVQNGADSARFTGRDWQRVCNRFGGRCAYCGASGSLTIDHVIPIIRGGRHAEGNILPACIACNMWKSARLLADWRLRLGGGVPHPVEALRP